MHDATLNECLTSQRKGEMPRTKTRSTSSELAKAKNGFRSPSSLNVAS